MDTYLRNVRKCFIALALLATAAFAQTGEGTVTGEVHDPSGALVANAGVTLLNTATGLTRTMNTTSAGVYNFTAVPVGPYKLTVNFTGFAPWETSFTLVVGQDVRADAALTVGNVVETVNVGAEAERLTTEGGAISDVKTAEQIHDLPVNGRQVSLLFQLTPGVQGGQTEQGGVNGNTNGTLAPRTNGMVVGSTDIQVDGQSYNSRFFGGMASAEPGLDSVQEYRVETAGSGAAYDTPATIELVTRSGTNQFHGAAFETLRDSFAGLEARTIQDATAPAKLIRNEFGGFIGGPIIKNHTFFFYDEEAMRQRQSVIAQASVPTNAMWGGDFSAITDAQGDKFQIYNPFSTVCTAPPPNSDLACGTYSRQPFANNQIPSSLLDTKFITALRAITPAPTNSNNPYLGPNFSASYPDNANYDSQTGRIDQIFGDKDSLSFRITHATNPSFFLNGGGGYGNALGYAIPGITDGPGYNTAADENYNTIARYTHTFNASLLNELQVGAFRAVNVSASAAYAVDWDSKLGLPNPFGAKGWPTLGFEPPFFGDGAYGYQDADNGKEQALTHYEIDDNVSWTKGRHSFKFGFKGRSEYNNVTEFQQSQGSNSFGGGWTGLYLNVPGGNTQPFTGDAIANAELGLPTYLSNQYNRGYFYLQQKELAFYGEDSWKVTPKLTLSLGLRWNYWTPYHEKNNRFLNIDLNNLNSTSIQVVTPGNTNLNNLGVPQSVLNSFYADGLTSVSANSIGFPSALIPNVWHDFSPHLAAAYRLTDKTVIRGGFSTFYYPMPLAEMLQSMRTNAPLNLRFQNIVSSNNAGPNSPNYQGNYAFYANPTPADILPGAGGTATVYATAPNLPFNFLGMDVNHWADNGYANWTFSIEHELPSNMLVRFSYVGSHGFDLTQEWANNTTISGYNYAVANGATRPTNTTGKIDPNWNLNLIEHNGYSNSSGFQATIDKRFSAGLSFSFSYVYTHMMTTDDSSGGVLGGGANSGGGIPGGGSSGIVPANNQILGDPNMTAAQRLRLLYTNSAEVPPQKLIWSGIYQLPVGKNKRFLGNANRLTDALVGGWQLAWIGTYDNGFWMGNSGSEYQFANPALSHGRHLSLNFGGTSQILWFAGDFDPTQASGVNLATLEALVPVNRGDRNIHPLGPNFNNQLPVNIGGTQQLIGYDVVSSNALNYMLGPAHFNQDATLFKYFGITERVKLRMSGDFFNVFNHPWLNNPNGTTGLIATNSQPNAPRIIQLGARVEF